MAQLVRQIAALEPPPVFFANLGDFAGPGMRERHAHYLRLVEPLPFPDVCVVGNHDLDDAGGWDAFVDVHGAANFDFAFGHTRFVVLHGEPGVVGRVEVTGSAGPRDDDLAFLDATLAAAAEPRRVVLMHMPPYLDGHYAPHPDWGFRLGRDERLGGGNRP